MQQPPAEYRRSGLEISYKTVRVMGTLLSSDCVLADPCSSQDETSANSKKCIQRNTMHCTLGFLLDLFP